MTLPLGRFVANDLDTDTAAALTQARVAAYVDRFGQLWRWDAFKVRYVRTPAGAKRYGVPIGSPIPVGRKVKPKSGGTGGGAAPQPGRPSAPNRVQLSPAERATAQRAYGGDNDHGARINDRGELEVTDNERAKRRLDAIAANPNASAAEKKTAQDLHRRLDVLPPDGSETDPDEQSTPDAAPTPSPNPPAAPPPVPEPAAPASPDVQVVDLEEADRAIVDEAFGGDEDHGARVNDAGQLEVTDPDRAMDRLTDMLSGDTSDADWSRIESIQDDLAELERPAAPGMTPQQVSDDYASKVELSQAQKDAVASYTSSGYHGINARLRGQDYSGAAVNDPAELQRQTDLIDEAMARYTTPDTITAHRSIYDESGFPDGDITGQVITSPGFSSTAVGRPAPGFGNGQNHLEITIPKGSHGIDVGGSGAGAFGGDEREFLLPHNTRYRVDSVEFRMKDGERQRVLKVTALPPAVTVEDELPLAASASLSPLPLGRFVRASGLASFKVRYVRTPAGARRYGVPIGSPIPIGRRVKPGTGGRGGRGGSRSAGPSGARRVPVPPAQRPAARRNFWGDNAGAGSGATWDDDANELDVHDPGRARATLDEALKDPSLDADQRRRTSQLRDRISGADDETAPAPPDEPATAEPEPATDPEPAPLRRARMPLTPDDQPVAERAFGEGTNPDDTGGRINDRGELELHDLERASDRLDAIAADDTVPDADRNKARQLEYRLHGIELEDVDESEDRMLADSDRITDDYRTRIAEAGSTIGQRRAVNDYVGTGYIGINGHLRGQAVPGDVGPDMRAAQVSQLDELFNAYSTPDAMQVRRFLSTDDTVGDSDVGKVITMSGLVSTTMGPSAPPHFESSPAVMNIRLPKGMPAVVPDGIGVGKPGEREMILPHGTQFRVDSISERGGKQWIEVTALPPVPTP